MIWLNVAIFVVVTAGAGVGTLTEISEKTRAKTATEQEKAHLGSFGGLCLVLLIAAWIAINKIYMAA